MARVRPAPPTALSYDGPRYANITFDELGALLGIEASKAERIAAKMLSEKRLNGSIDQLEARLYFELSYGDHGATECTEGACKEGRMAGPADVPPPHEALVCLL